MKRAVHKFFAFIAKCCAESAGLKVGRTAVTGDNSIIMSLDGVRTMDVYPSGGVVVIVQKGEITHYHECSAFAPWWIRRALLSCLLLSACSLTSCESMWATWYRHQGGYYQRPSQPTPAQAAENVRPREGSSQPTHH